MYWQKRRQKEKKKEQENVYTESKKGRQEAL